MYGLAEAIVYSLNLYALSFSSIKDSLSNDLQNDKLRTLTSEAHVEITQSLSDIKSIIGSGYSADVLMRNLHGWMDVLNKASVDGDAVALEYEQIGLSGGHLNFVPCPGLRGPTMSQTYVSIKEVLPKQRLHPCKFHLVWMN